MEKLFTYGSLQLLPVQKKLFNRKLAGTSDILLGYEIGTIKIDGKIFNIATPKTESWIEGIVYNLTKEDLKITDRYEGRMYKRMIITLQSGIESWVYLRV